MSPAIFVSLKNSLKDRDITNHCLSVCTDLFKRVSFSWFLSLVEFRGKNEVQSWLLRF